MLSRFIDNPREDSLTAAVFSHLLHLPIELFWQVLRNACGSEHLPAYPGELIELSAWPSWCAKDTRNSSRVIPDLFLRFAELDLIVEAKRWDAPMQNPEQWRKEVQAYANEYAESRRPMNVRLLALGFPRTVAAPDVVIEARPEKPGIRCPVICCQWAGLLDQCKRLERELSEASFVTAQGRAAQRILGDVIDLFGGHGFQTGLWFSELVPALSRNSGRLSRHDFPFGINTPRHELHKI